MCLHPQALLQVHLPPAELRFLPRLEQIQLLVKVGHAAPLGGRHGRPVEHDLPRRRLLPVEPFVLPPPVDEDGRSQRRPREESPREYERMRSAHEIAALVARLVLARSRRRPIDVPPESHLGHSRNLPQRRVHEKYDDVPRPLPQEESESDALEAHRRRGRPRPPFGIMRHEDAAPHRSREYEPRLDHGDQYYSVAPFDEVLGYRSRFAAGMLRGVLRVEGGIQDVIGIPQHALHGRLARSLVGTHGG
mmetsp:Transcript_15960/g.45898  ORF Transcript_15960/g.45898 Transcript_15960/m.45898 type:complete len:248 (+) Transcript_15960:124-867(+)